MTGTNSPTRLRISNKKVLFLQEANGSESPGKRNIFQIINGIDAKTGKVRADVRGRNKSLYQVDELKSGSIKVNKDGLNPEKINRTPNIKIPKRQASFKLDGTPLNHGETEEGEVSLTDSDSRTVESDQSITKNQRLARDQGIQV